MSRFWDVVCGYIYINNFFFVFHSPLSARVSCVGKGRVGCLVGSFTAMVVHQYIIAVWGGFASLCLVPSTFRWEIYLVSFRCVLVVGPMSDKLCLSSLNLMSVAGVCCFWSSELESRVRRSRAYEG
jgi:hypothetical protein